MKKWFETTDPNDPDIYTCYKFEKDGKRICFHCCRLPPVFKFTSVPAKIPTRMNELGYRYVREICYLCQECYVELKNGWNEKDYSRTNILD